MTRITKIELEQMLAKANAEIIALRLKNSILVAELERSKRTSSPVTQPRNIVEEKVIATYTKRDGSQWKKIKTGFNSYVHRLA